ENISVKRLTTTPQSFCFAKIQHLPPLCRLSATSLPAGESLAPHKGSQGTVFHRPRRDVGIPPYNRTRGAAVGRRAADCRPYEFYWDCGRTITVNC
ncbi:MAG: hypothetical protein IJO41_04405, partial [Oscillospiraceae bacterium]|nr:hypothetical protein [Oscillospiraceae bacterium]